MSIERTTTEEMHCSMGGCSNIVRDVGMREGEGVYTIEEIAIDAGWKIEEFKEETVHICPRCASDTNTDDLVAVIDGILAMLKPTPELIANAKMDYQAAFEFDVTRNFYHRAMEIAGRAE